MVAPGLRKRSKRRKPMPVSEKVQIVHQVLVDQEMLKDVAREYRVSVPVVFQLVKKAREKPRFLEELIHQRDEISQRRTRIATIVEEMNQAGVIIDSAAMVQKRLQD